MTTNEEKIKNMANKILKEIKKMNLPKEVLRSLNFKDLIDNILFKLDKKHTIHGDDLYYGLFDYIIEKCTNISLNDSPCLWHCHKSNDYDELFHCVSVIDNFNNQMAEYFDESIF